MPYVLYYGHQGNYFFSRAYQGAYVQKRTHSVCYQCGICFQGSSTVLYAATSPELEGRDALYLHAMKEAPPSKLGQDADLAKALWVASSFAAGWTDQDEKASVW